MAVLAVWAFALRLTRQTPAAPMVREARNEAESVSLKTLKGKYVLVNFWDSHNAVSRIAAGEYDRFIRSHKGEGIELVSVNTDDDQALFSELVNKDGLDRSTQFHIKDVKAEAILKGYKPLDGYSSYLVNPEGKIVAYNPSIETLEKYLQ